MSAPSATDTRDRELVLSRTFDAPRELVWKVWTDAHHLVHWYGPAGFRTTTSKMEVRPGGQWRFVMHGPDGHDYQNLITYLEVAEPERLRYKHGGDTPDNNLEPVNFEVMVTFEPEGARGERTKVTMRSIFPSAEARDFVVREYNAIEGGKQTLSRLAEHLQAVQSRTTEETPFILTRVFKAPRELVWAAWTREEHLKKWFGPKGTTIPKCSLDLRPGGVFHYCMRLPGGDEFWGRWTIREVTPPERLVFVVSFADDQGNAVRAPWDELWPLETLSTITFAEHAGIGRGTVVTVHWEPINATPAERAKFMDGHASMQQGWGGTMDQLDAFLSGQ